MNRKRTKLPSNRIDAAEIVASELESYLSDNYRKIPALKILSKRFKISVSSLNGYLKILEATPYLQSLIKEGLLPIGISNKIVFQPTDVQDIIAKKAYLNNLRQKEVDQLIAQYKDKVSNKSNDKAPIYTIDRDTERYIESIVERYGVLITIPKGELKVQLKVYDPQLGRDLMWSGSFINSGLRCETSNNDPKEPTVSFIVSIYAAEKSDMDLAIKIIFDSFENVEKVRTARKRAMERMK